MSDSGRGMRILAMASVIGSSAVAWAEFPDELLSPAETGFSMTTINTFRPDASARLYQTRFDGDDWSGGLSARPITADGAVGSPRWDAADQIPESGSRNIWTYDSDAVSGDARGIPFLWDSLTSEQRAHLNTDGMGAPDPVDNQRGAERLGYLRGQQDDEQRHLGRN